jgi:hypothetical protein
MKYKIQYVIKNKVMEEHGFFGLNKLNTPFTSLSQVLSRIKKLKLTGQYNVGVLSYVLIQNVN